MRECYWINGSPHFFSPSTFQFEFPFTSWWYSLINVQCRVFPCRTGQGRWNVRSTYLQAASPHFHIVPVKYVFFFLNARTDLLTYHKVCHLSLWSNLFRLSRLQLGSHWLVFFQPPCVSCGLVEDAQNFSKHSLPPQKILSALRSHTIQNCQTSETQFYHFPLTI